MSNDLLVSLTDRPVIGHRGAAGLAPENTIASFRLALEVGAEALEFDVRVTRDGVPVVIHDPSLERTTDRRGLVADLTLSDVRAADAGHYFSDNGGTTFPWRAQGLKVPTLEEVIAEFPGVPYLVEIKGPQASGAVAALLLRSGAADRAVVAGADWRSIEPFRIPPFTAGASRRDIARLYFRTGQPQSPCRAFAVPARFYFLPVPTRRFVAAAHALGASVHVWTVDRPATALALWKTGVNGIVTNRPDLIRAVRDRGSP